VLENSGGGTYDVEVNGTLRGSVLGGPWSLVPNYVDISAWAVPNGAAPFALFVRLKNTSGSGSILVFQAAATVLR